MEEGCLLLRLEGPLQSWGYRSRFRDRDTGLEPTKSGVIGLLCCALGRRRDQDIADLRALRMHVRVERPGQLLREFQTAGAGNFRGSKQYYAPKSGGGKGTAPVLMDKHYLQDACFLVALEGDMELLKVLNNALNDPVWPLNLGRKSCPPATPLVVQLLQREEATNWVNRKWLTDLREYEPKKGTKRLVAELPMGNFEGDPRQDVPMSWPDRHTREYATRYVHASIVEVTE